MPTTLLLLAALLAPEAPPLPGPGSPALSWEGHTRCVTRADGTRWRVQCDEETRTCLWAADAELDAEGRPSGRLDRARHCDSLGGEAQWLEAYRRVPAIAEAPPGWRRDARNRVLQEAFDLQRRAWLGAGFVPVARGPGALQGSLSLGFQSTWRLEDDDQSHLLRLTLLTGEAFSDLSWLEATALHFDTRRGGRRPGLRLTTFLGTPARHDLDLSFGFWMDALGIELHDAGARRHARLSIGALGGTLDLWHSRDLESFVRLRTDAEFEQDRTTRVFNVVPTGALEAEVVLGEKGLHHVRALAQYGRVVPIARAGQGANRLRLRLGYEVGLVAINDQPLTAVIEGRLDRRGDLPDLPEDWEAQALASLRFSLWVPARRDAKSQTAL